MSKKQIGIHIGALCEPIVKQLNQQGIRVTPSDVSHFQRAHDGIVQLRVLGCLTDSETHRVSQKLVRKIGNYCVNFKPLSNE